MRTTVGMSGLLSVAKCVPSSLDLGNVAEVRRTNGQHVLTSKCSTEP